MCGRFTLGETDKLAELFDLREWSPVPARYNVAPSQAVPVVVLNRETAAREVRRMRWGLVPFWAKDPTIGDRMINARAETVTTKPAFRRSFRERRCLIAADGFYEWQRQGRRKQPWYIRRRDGWPFAFAGLWDVWQPPVGEPLETCTIITTTPNALLAPIHNRMPVSLARLDFARWLDPTYQDLEPLTRMLVPCPAEDFEAFPVSPHVNNPANEGAECRAPLLKRIEPGA